MLSLAKLKTSIKKPITVKDLIKEGACFLINHNILNGKNEIEWYLQHLYKCDKSNLFQISDNNVNDFIYNQTLNFLKERSQKIPFQYILGQATFYGRDYFVNSNTLIPRPETELLIDIIKDKKCKKLLDIGTGTGCLGITAVLEKIADSVDLIDINNEALKTAKENAQKFKIKNTRYFQLDILNDIPPIQYDIIISNPPYISDNEYNLLETQVKKYEPYNALTDMKDGYTFYERYADILNKILTNKGIAVFEISHFFPKTKLLKIFNKFSNIRFYKDLNGGLRAIKIIND